jgi:hypothetical protein
VTVLDRLLRTCRESNPKCEIININPHEDGVRASHRHLPLAATTALEALDNMLVEYWLHSSLGSVPGDGGLQASWGRGRKFCGQVGENED